MPDRHDTRLHRYFERIEGRLPDKASRPLRWLRQPAVRWVRIPAGLLLIVGGIFGFLPVLGFWMIPLGLLLLALDMPFLRAPVARALVWLDRRRPRRRPRRDRDSDPA